MAPSRLFATLLGAMFLMLVGHAPAEAAVFDVRFCVEVVIDLIDPDVGDRWTQDGATKPARGFQYALYDRNDLPDPIDSGFLFADGAWVGCTPIELNLSDTTSYGLVVESFAEVDSLNSVAVSTAFGTQDAVALYTSFVPTADGVVIAPAIDGAAHPFFNHAAIASFALFLHDGSASGKFVQVFEDGCCSWDEGSGAAMHVDDGVRSKVRFTKLLGNLIAQDADVGNAPAIRNYASLDNNCDGSDESTDYGLLTKEWHSGSAVEGLADFYSAITWNYTTENDCEISKHYRNDWDNDGSFDTSIFDALDCEGDPNGGTDYVTSTDWLMDVVNASDPDGCVGPSQNRSTEYDWLRFWWDLVTDGDNQGNLVSINKVWNIWDDMDPNDWDSSEISLDIFDDPLIRLFNACLSNSVGDACSEQDHNGQLIH